MTTPHLKAIRERAKALAEAVAGEPDACSPDLIDLATDYLALLDLIEKPDDAAVARARAAYYDPANARGGRLRAALRAAYTEE